jgi:signal transduction histidine kinase
VNLSLEKKIDLGFLLVFAVGLLMAGLAWRSASLSLRTFRAVDLTRKTLADIEQTLVDLLTVETYSRGYLLRGDERWLDTYRERLARLRADVPRLRAATAGNPGHQARVGRFEQVLEKELEVIETRVTTYRAKGLEGVLDTALNIPGDGRIRVATLRDLLQTIEKEESARLSLQSAEAQSAALNTMTMVAIMTLSAAVFVGYSTVVVRRGFRLRQQFENQIRQQNLELENVNRELDAFSYSISHDLRSPLRGINGWSQAITEDCADLLDERGQGHLQRIRAETQRMGQLIDDLLRLSQLAKSRMAVTRVDLSALAGGIVARLREANPGRTVECVIQSDLHAQGDAGLLDALLTNLLENAWKFTGKVPAARIEFTSEEQEGETVFCIRDNGAGFDMTYAAKLFSAFQRMHKMAEFPGTGVGLATVQRILNRHGGRIWADARVNQGAAFFFTLPPRETPPPP